MGGQDIFHSAEILSAASWRDLRGGRCRMGRIYGGKRQGGRQAVFVSTRFGRSVSGRRVYLFCGGSVSGANPSSSSFAFVKSSILRVWINACFIS